jgi:hypothetical protein
MKSEWIFECDTAVFERIKSEANFQQVVALARAVNSLEFALSAIIADAQDHSSNASRSRINSFLFGSAILYEGLLLVERMNKEFGNNDIFEQGLHTLLKDPVARKLRSSHMGPARNSAVFHYDPEEFGEILSSASVDECQFMVGRENPARDIYFPFADTLAAELLMGRAAADEGFYEELGSVINETRKLAVRFIELSHRLIVRCLQEWGFAPRTLP